MLEFIPGSVEADYAGHPEWRELLLSESTVRRTAETGHLAVSEYQRAVALRPVRVVSEATATAEARAQQHADREPVYGD